MQPQEIANEVGALSIKLNGPRQWVLDDLGTKAAPAKPLMREFNGIMMRRIAVVELALGGESSLDTAKSTH